MSLVGQRERLTQQQVAMGYRYKGGCKACDGNGCDFSKEGGTWQ